ncbi:hypothetical protein EPA93_03840 [Ktedonosporobacter rubrisoli]|uniref:Uncharacterized protein n=1 Tax=Ktedonosporobacter rubrisoli TaxID=2509675 RepID=A0A4P6JJQ5_KTERU|nr:hypothetical protein [Ktedonosporobacter rubrisoli]QBD75170.1 hypothetical protein EPA93_03840 [Ktedonosporobacter rubrisoli]
MFDNILRELKKIEAGSQITISMPTDNDGYFDRRCPSEACQADFKVLMEDWKQKVSDAQVFCPICREEAKATEWSTSEQQEYIRQAGINYIQGKIGQALSQDARDFNRRQRPGFINMSMSYKPGAPTLIIPISAAEELRQKFTCEQCGCRYSSLGAAFFCPACGHNSAESTFSQTIEAVQKSLSALLAIREAVQAVADADAAKNTVREILENNMGRLVGAFQRLAEALFDRTPAAPTTRRRKNVFQNLSEGSALWNAATGKGYADLLTPAEMADLLRLFQQRHLFAHCEGIVDQDYITKSGDTTYVIGQRLVIREGAVSRLAELVTKLADELRKLV